MLDRESFWWIGTAGSGEMAEGAIVQFDFSREFL